MRALELVQRDLKRVRQEIRALETELSRTYTSGEVARHTRIRSELSSLHERVLHLTEEARLAYKATPQARVRPPAR